MEMLFVQQLSDSYLRMKIAICIWVTKFANTVTESSYSKKQVQLSYIHQQLHTFFQTQPKDRIQVTLVLEKACSMWFACCATYIPH